MMSNSTRMTRRRHFQGSGAVVAWWVICLAFTTGASGDGVPGDFDGDENVDVRDFAAFQECYTGAGGSYDRNGVTTHEVLVGPGPFFEPDELVIEANDTVRWVWTCGLHNVVSGLYGEEDGVFDSGPPTYEEGTIFEVTFDDFFLQEHRTDDDRFPYFSEPLRQHGMNGLIDADRLPCAVFDFDIDGDIDEEDFAVFSDFFTGPVERCEPQFGFELWESDITLESIVVVDLDGDNLADVLVGNHYSDGPNLFILFGRDGGGFAPPQLIDAGDRPDYLVVEDLNNDQLPDIIVGGFRKFSILINRGDRSFAAPSTYQFGERPFAAATGDINGDEHPDLVVADSTGESLFVFRNKGNGAFLGPERIEFGARVRSVALADIDGDRDLDLVASSGLDILWFENDGGGSFEPPTPILEDFNHSSILVSDLDRDGKPDVALVALPRDEDDYKLFLLINDGRGGFTFEEDAVLSGRPGNMAVADLDQDEHVDIIVGMRTLERDVSHFVVLFNDGDAHFTRPRSFGAGLHEFGVGDLDGDGALDIAAVYTRCPENGSCNSSNVAFLHNDGSGRFPGYETFAVHEDAYHVSTGDFNGDGIDDLVVTGFGDTPLTIMTSRPGGGYAQVSPDGLGGRIRSTTIMDIDEDGDLDVLVPQFRSILVLLNDGLGRFSNGLSLGTGENPWRVIAADFNGDQFQDLATANHGDSTVSILLGLGGGAFEDAVELPLREGQDAPSDIAAADFDGDEDIDLVVVSEDVWAVLLLRNNGDGTFEEPQVIDSRSARSVDVADFDGDGDVDIVASGPFEFLWIYENDGFAGFSRVTLDDDVAAGGRGANVVDLDRDGDPDLVMTRPQEEQVLMFFNDGHGNFFKQAAEQVFDGPYWVTPAHFNGDGDPDLAVVSFRTGTVSVIINDCAP